MILVIDIMNKKIVIFTVITAFLFGMYIYFDYKNNPEETVNETIYFLQIGAYKNSNNVTKVTKLVNHNYVEFDNGIYYIYVGITSSKEALEKIKAIYTQKGTDIYVKEKKVKNKKFLDYLKKYDSMIIETDNKELIDSILKDVLKNYEKIS